MRSKLHQTLTYWQLTSKNSFGENQYAAPVLMMGRWEDRTEQVQLPTGQIVESKAIVFVPQDVAEDDVLAEGDWTAVADPSMVAKSREVQGIVKVPSLRSNAYERRAIL